MASGSGQPAVGFVKSHAFVQPLGAGNSVNVSPKSALPSARRISSSNGAVFGSLSSLTSDHTCAFGPVSVVALGVSHPNPSRLTGTRALFASFGGSASSAPG